MSAAARSSEDMNLWQQIFTGHWDGFIAEYEREHGTPAPEYWRESGAVARISEDMPQGNRLADQFRRFETPDQEIPL